MSKHYLFSDAAIDKLAPPVTGTTDYRDFEFPGFGIRVTSKGTKSFYLRCRANGGLIRLNLGRHPDVPLSTARSLAEKLRTVSEAGGDPRRALGPDNEQASICMDYSFNDILQAYLNLHCRPNNRASTTSEKQRLLRSVFAPRWQDRDVRTLSKSDVLAVTDSILDRGKPSAARHAFKAIQSFFSWCVRRDLITTSPCLGLLPPAPARFRDRVLSDAEIRTIWHTAGRLKCFGDIVKLCLLTGQRRGEVAGMRWSELDDQRQLWCIPGHRTKNGKPHTVPLAQQALALIGIVGSKDGSRVARSSNYVFPSHTDGRHPYAGFSKAKRTLNVMTGLNDWTLHDLRRTMASRMAELGVEPHIIEKVLNHASGSFSGVAGIYNRYDYVDEKRDALARWASKLSAILEDEPRPLSEQG